MLTNLLNIFFPPVCNHCKNTLTDHESFLCISCRHLLPVTNFHFKNDFTVKNVLYGRANIQSGTALLRFSKHGIVQHLLHQLKYGKNQEVGMFLGSWLGEELKSIKDYSTIDVVIPVPLHPKKLKKRGYNQVAKFGEQIAVKLEANYDDNTLIKTSVNKASQASKKRIDRWYNNKELFDIVNVEHLENKHILLVDDVITTGNTIEACCLQLQKAKNIKISIACMAIA